MDEDEDEEEERQQSKPHQHLKSALRKVQASVPREGSEDLQGSAHAPSDIIYAADKNCTRLVSKSQRMTASHRV